MNTKTKSKGLNSKRKLKQLRLNSSTNYISWKTQIQRGWIVFGLITVFSLSGSAQCGVRDLPDSTQKMILEKFILLDRCDSLNVRKNELIYLLKTDKLILQQENKQSRANVEQLKLTALKRKKWPWIAGVVGFGVGMVVGSRIK